MSAFFIGLEFTAFLQLTDVLFNLIGHLVEVLAKSLNLFGTADLDPCRIIILPQAGRTL